MEWIQQLQNAVNYMEEHLLDNINYEDAAKSVYMSSYNFHRTFSLMAGMTANLRMGYTIWETEPTDYVVFQCIGDNGDCITEAWSRFFKEFLPQSGYVQTERTDYEIYFENGESGVFCELWIPVTKK